MQNGVTEYLLMKTGLRLTSSLRVCSWIRLPKAVGWYQSWLFDNGSWGRNTKEKTLNGKGIIPVSELFQEDTKFYGSVKVGKVNRVVKSPEGNAKEMIQKKNGMCQNPWKEEQPDFSDFSFTRTVDSGNKRLKNNLWPRKYFIFGCMAWCFTSHLILTLFFLPYMSLNPKARYLYCVL